jgi:hypothetical protein
MGSLIQFDSAAQASIDGAIESAAYVSMDGVIFVSVIQHQAIHPHQSSTPNQFLVSESINVIINELPNGLCLEQSAC